VGSLAAIRRQKPRCASARVALTSGAWQRAALAARHNGRSCMRGCGAESTLMNCPIKPAPTKQRLRQAWRQADRLSRRGQWAAAAPLYECAASGPPGAEDPRLWIRIGICRHALGNLAGAREAFSHALSINAAHLPARYHLAIVELDDGALDRARALLNEVIEHQSENLPARCLRALADYREGNRAEALEQMERHFCANTDFLTRLAITLEAERLETEQRQRDPAIPSPTPEPRASTPSPFPQGRSVRRLLSACARAFDAQDYDAAHQIARRMVQIHPRNGDARLALGYAAMEAGYPGEAERALAQALYLQRRETIRAALRPCLTPTRPRILRALRHHAPHPAVNAMRALALIRLGRPAEARRLLGNVPVEGPESYNKFYYLGICALAEGRCPDAARYFRYAFDHYGVDTLELCLPRAMDWARRRFRRSDDPETRSQSSRSQSLKTL